MKRLILSVVLLVSMANASAAVAMSDDDGVGVVTYVSGEAFVIRNQKLSSVSDNMTLLSSDVLVTRHKGRVSVKMFDNSKIYVGSQSRIRISEYVKEEGVLSSGTFNMLWGKVRFLVSKLSEGSGFKVGTRTAVLGVRGTEFVVVVPLPEGVEDPTSIKLSPNLPDLMTTVYGLEGLVEGVSLDGERILIGPGVKVEFSADKKAVLTFDQEPKNLPSVGVPDITPVEPDVPDPADIPVPTPQEPVIQQPPPQLLY